MLLRASDSRCVPSGMQELPHDRAQLIAAASARRAALTEAGVYAEAVSCSPFLFGKSPSAAHFELAATLACVALVLRSMSGAVSAVRAEQAMLADNRDVLQRRLEKSLVQRAELAKQFGRTGFASKVQSSWLRWCGR